MRTCVAVCLVAGILGASPALAQQRPLVTEDPETVGTGLVLLEGGIDYQRDVFYPASGLRGHLLRVPSLGVSVGISSIAEIQIDGGLYQRLSVTDRRPAPLAYLLDFSGDQTSDMQDFTFGTKIRLLSEAPGRPAIAVRVATRLPTASNETGLGLDTLDFYVSGLVGKTVQSIRVVGNFGVGVLADPVQGNRQNDVLTYGFSLARAVAEGVEIVGEINGHVNVRKEVDTPPGTETRGTVRAGARFTRGTVRLDGGIMIGTTSRDTELGFTAGFTWVFRGFTLP
jgi:hypothetical protein